MSPGVAIASRAPARNSRNGCSSAGRGLPNSRSQTSEPNETMQDNRPSRSRNPTARSRLAMSAHSERTAVSASGPGLTVTTRKIAAGVSGAATSCDSARVCPARPGVLLIHRLRGVVPRGGPVSAGETRILWAATMRQTKRACKPSICDRALCASRALDEPLANTDSVGFRTAVTGRHASAGIDTIDEVAPRYCCDCGLDAIGDISSCAATGSSHRISREHEGPHVVPGLGGRVT